MGEWVYLVAISSLLLVAAALIPVIRTIIPYAASRITNKFLGCHARLSSKDKIKLGIFFYCLMGLMKFVELYVYKFGNIYWPFFMTIIDAVFWPLFVGFMILDDLFGFHQNGILTVILLLALGLSTTLALAIRMTIKKSVKQENSSG